MKRHPFVLGIILLAAVSALFFLLVYVSSSGDFGHFSFSEKVGVIAISGIITDPQGPVHELKRFGDDRSVKAVVIRIDSPGGGVAASQEILQGIAELKKKKKVVASLGALAASGGYLIACGADEIVANPGTITGSISAIMQFPNVEELFKKLGLKSTVVKSGKFKDIGSPTREMTAEEKALLQALVDDIYDQFVEAVAEARKIPREEIAKVADGRVFTGKKAKDLKLVDHLGDLPFAIQLAGRLAGIKGEPEVVYAQRRIASLWDLIFGRFSETGTLLKKHLHPAASYQYF